MRNSFVVIVWLIIFAGFCAAQTTQESSPQDINYVDNCEGNMARLDSVRSEALKSDGKDTAVIVIARLGKGEVARVHNRSRLSAAKKYLVQFGLPVNRLVLAEGEKAESFGRVELYVAGKLQDALLVNRNKGLCVECCNPSPEDFINNRTPKKRRG